MELAGVEAGSEGSVLWGISEWTIET